MATRTMAVPTTRGLSEAWDEEDARGYVMGFDDPSMGWSRYAESMRIATLRSWCVVCQVMAARS